MRLIYFIGCALTFVSGILLNGIRLGNYYPKVPWPMNNGVVSTIIQLTGFIFEKFILRKAYRFPKITFAASLQVTYGIGRMT
jgi:hypothetical protein